MIFVRWIQDPKTSAFYFKRDSCHATLIVENLDRSQRFDDIPRGWFEITPKLRVDVFEYDWTQHRKGWDAWQSYRSTHPRTRGLPMIGHLIGGDVSKTEGLSLYLRQA